MSGLDKIQELEALKWRRRLYRELEDKEEHDLLRNAYLRPREINPIKIGNQNDITRPYADERQTHELLNAIDHMKRKIRGDSPSEQKKSFGRLEQPLKMDLTLNSNIPTKPAKWKDTSQSSKGIVHDYQTAPAPDRSEQILTYLQRQELRNEKALKELKEHLDSLIRQESTKMPIAEMTGKTSLQDSARLLQEINTLKVDYIRNGGRNQQLINDMDRTFSDALQLHEIQGNTSTAPIRKERIPTRSVEDTIISEIETLESKNRNLEKKLEKLKKGKRQSETMVLGEGVQTWERSKSREGVDPIGEKDNKTLASTNTTNPSDNELNRGLTAGANNWRRQPVPLTEENNSLYTTGIANKKKGFVVFIDFITGLSSHVPSVRIVLCLFNNIEKLGDPVISPIIRTDAFSYSNFADPETSALMQFRLPISDCPQDSLVACIVEYQEMEPKSGEMLTRAWSKLWLFDQQKNCLRGWWRTPLRLLPIKPHLSTTHMETIPQYANSMIHYRLLSYDGVQSESDVIVNVQSSYLYNFTSQKLRGLESQNLRVIPPILRDIDRTNYQMDMQEDVPPGPKIDPPDEESEEEEEKIEDFKPDDDNDLTLEGMRKELTLGFQVDRVKHATDVTIGKVRLTAYYAGTREVVQSLTSPVTCSTSAVRANFKIGYHVFGLQEATFYEVDFRPDMVLIARFYNMLTPKSNRDEEKFESAAGDGRQGSMSEEWAKIVSMKQRNEVQIRREEDLVAWAAMPIMVPPPQEIGFDRWVDSQAFKMRGVRVNIGSHDLQLYEPPVIEAERIMSIRDWKPSTIHKPYGKARLRIHVFHPIPRAGSLTPSEDEEEPEDTHQISSSIWIPTERLEPPHRPYNASDAFDLYVDSCRFLPDCTTVVKIRGRILDRRYQTYGQEITCITSLHSDVLNPTFDHREEFREPILPPSSTILFKIYSMDRFSKRLVLIGYAALNLFVEIGTERQPSSDLTGIQVALNEGAHQCRIYWRGPNGKEPLYGGWMREKRIRPVLGASLLVRIVKAPVAPDGQPITRSQVPQSEWRSLGLIVHKPTYTDRVYYSMTCKPSRGELLVMKAHEARPKVSLADIIPELAGRRMEVREDVLEYNETVIPKLFEGEYASFEICYLSQYVPKYGFKISVDGAVSLPWNNFTLAHFCLNPPGAYYLGKPHAAYDRLLFTENLDYKSTNRSPMWLDSWRGFKNRAYHRHMTLVIHLQEISVTITGNNYRYSLLNQAWTALPIFEYGFVFTDAYQLPLFLGFPTPEILTELTKVSFLTFLQKNINTGLKLPLIEGASVIARVCDTRREEELSAIKSFDEIYLDQRYLPSNILSAYTLKAEGVTIADMVPVGKTPTEFLPGLVNKFKSLVYKLYEDEKIFSS